MGNLLLDRDRITEQELAEYWGIKKQTLQKWRSLGLGPVYIKIGARVLYPSNAIIEYERDHMYAGSGKKVDVTDGGKNE